VGGLALTAPVARASSEDDDAMFVHIDGVVSGAEGTFKIDIDVAGTERDLRGEGWDVDPDENHPTACIFVQSGSIRRDVVELQGRAIFANDPANFGALVKTRASAETGRIDWDFGGFLFTGSGRVVVARRNSRPTEPAPAAPPRCHGRACTARPTLAGETGAST
jgi:hypothetical protein